MQVYHDLLNDILKNGQAKQDRTTVGTLSVFGRQLRFDLRNSFPAITTKKLAWKAVVGELLWFIEGSGDNRRLAEITHGPGETKETIWTPNANAEYWKDKAKFHGDLGRIYGVQWRKWRSISEDPDSKVVTIKEIDQLKNLVEGLKKDPHSRRHVLTSWNPGELDQMALPPCHVMCQFYVNNKELSCHMFQRSVDVFLGLPFNIASYALLTHLLAQVCDYKVGDLILSTSDTHIYQNHVEQVKEQLTRTPYDLPKLWLNPDIKEIDKFTMDDIKLIDYQSHGQLKAPMAV